MVIVTQLTGEIKGRRGKNGYKSLSSQGKLLKLDAEDVSVAAADDGTDDLTPPTVPFPPLDPLLPSAMETRIDSTGIPATVFSSS